MMTQNTRHSITIISIITTVLCITNIISPPPVKAARFSRDGPMYPIKRLSKSVVAEVVNATTVILRNLPQTTNNPNCPISGYKVRVKQEGIKKPQVRDVEGVRQTITLQYLLPNATYHIRLISIQCDGKGKQNKRLTVRIPALFSDIGQPEIVNSKGFADSIFLAWTPPISSISIRGYIVGYGEGVPDVNWQYLDVTQRNITVRNLKKNTQYMISVRAFHNDIIRGPPVLELVNTAENSDPEPPPTPVNLKTKVTSPTTITLEWIDPSLYPSSSHVPTDSRYYLVHYSHFNPVNGRLIEKNEKFTKLQGVISNLIPATSYDFKVRTVNEGYFSNYSVSVRERTLEAAPGSQPRNVTVHELNVDDQNKLVSALVRWKPPKHLNANITDYEIRYTDKLDSIYGDCQMKSVRQQTEVVIENLILGNSYFFQVQPKNAFGYGPKSDIIKFQAKKTLDPSQTLPPPNDDRQSGNIDNNNDNNDDDDDDNIDHDNMDSDDNILDNNNQDIFDEDYEDDYESEVDNQHQSTNLHIPSSETITKRKRKQTLTFPDDSDDPYRKRPSHVHVDFKVILQVKVNAFITWPISQQTSSEYVSDGGVKCQSSERPKGYKIRYKKSEQQHQQLHHTNPQPWISRNLRDNMVVLEDLEANCKYVYQVKYVVDTDSPWSFPQHISTYPQKDQMIN